MRDRFKFRVWNVSDKIKRIDTYQINGDIIGNIHETPELLENN